MIVREHLASAGRVVVEVLDDERVIQIDDRRDRRSVREDFVRGMSLHDGHAGLARISLQILGRDRIGAAAGAHETAVAFQVRSRESSVTS